MSKYLPIGAALYQASNTQLQHVASSQLQIASPRTLRLPDRKGLPLRGWRKLMGKWGAYNVTQQAMACILCGITAQVRLELHPSLLVMRALTLLQIICTLLVSCLSR